MTALSRNDIASYLTTAEMARELRVSTQTVRTHAFDLGGRRVGGQWRFENPTARRVDTTSPKRAPRPNDKRYR